MEAELMVRVPGMYKSFDELEENLSLDDLEVLLIKTRDVEKDRQRFMAAMQGIDLDEKKSEQKDKYEEIVRRAEARRLGKSVEELELEEFGIQIYAGE
jgi:hypothetical protein